jgi:hypothetical protein
MMMTEDAIRHLLREIFNYDFAACKDSADFHKHFFGPTLAISDLARVFAMVCAQSVEIGGRTVPAAVTIKGKKTAGAPFAILAQLHGNEPAGLAGILLAMALSQAGKLEQDVIGVIGNPLAAGQYFEAYLAHPRARQETRDAYRCGLSDSDELLPDMNRIPVDFMQRKADDHHTRRAQELYTLGQHISGILDIHSARGNMLCVTDHKRDADLKYSPIRSVLIGLADAISANASGTVTVQTLKTILFPLPTIVSQTGIEAGRHEAAEAPGNASAFTLSLLHTLNITSIKPIDTRESGVFNAYRVKPRLTYGDLAHKKPEPADRIYMARECRSPDDIPPRSDRVIVQQQDGSYRVQTVLEYIIKPAGRLFFVAYQYDEMEEIKKDQVVAVAIPSGTLF